MDRGVKLEAAATLTHASCSHSCLLSSSLHCSCLQQRFWLPHLWWLIVFLGETWLFCSQSRIMGKDYFFLNVSRNCRNASECSTDSCLGWLHLQHLSHFWHIFIFHTDQSIVCVFLCQGSFGALIIGCANIAWGAAANFAAEFLHVLKYCVLACVLHGVLGYCILSRCLFASKTLFSNLRSHD